MGADERSDGEARPGGGAGLSFGFKAKKPQAVKFAVQGAKKEEVREEILVLSSESFETTNPSQQTTKKDVPVIPKIENTFQVGVGRTDPRFRADRFLPPSGESARVADGEDRFVAAEKDEQTAAVKYGLQQKGRQGRVDGTERKPIDSREQEERQLLKQDMEQLPEEADEKAYDRMPIEDFGMAMLRGMGWSEGKPIGRNTKEAAAAIEYVKRPDRLGLGAQPAKLVGKDPTRPVKPGESRERKVMVAAPAENGAARSVKKLDEKLVEAEEPGARPGKTMRIRKGTHAGLWCVVLQLLEQEPGRSERARVRLQPSEQEVTVRCSELEEKGKIMDAEERREEKRKAKRRREEAAGDVATDTKRDAGPGSRERRPWLRAEIRVRVVSRGLERGRLYLRKAVVIDVVAPGVCDIRLDDDGRVVQGVAQADLETVVPKKEGGTVQVVRGRQGGQFGVLLGRNKQTQLVAVKLHGEDEVLKLHLNDIAEYTGVVSHLE